ncbi:MAG: hypothetical protein HFI40_15910 [Lachnospiraceae bacterium]|jgi:hypothetical protein|nr:hypothetical protein [Lachnospiraceae bacterium]
MVFFKRPYLVRRYQQSCFVRGYPSKAYEDIKLLLDVQTLENEVVTTPDGSRSVKRLEVYCDEELRVADVGKQQEADRIWFQGKWFTCQSSFLSDNTLLRHWLSEFVECLDQDDAPKEVEGKNESIGTKGSAL